MNLKSPKYATVMAQIATLVKDSPVGTALPTERELATMFGTSRTTVRQALAALASTGRVERTQGSGTFVSEPRRVVVNQLTSYTDDLRAQGHTTSSEIVRIDREPAGADVIDALDLSPETGTSVMVVERVRSVDGEPLAVEVAHLPGRLPRLRKELEKRGSLYATLDSVYDIRIDQVEDLVEAEPATPREATLLHVEVGAPLLVIRRSARDKGGKPVEYTRSVFRGNRFQFVARSER